MQIANGTYAGDGTDARNITGVGFDPDGVLLWGLGASANAVMRLSGMTANQCKELISTTATSSLIDILTGLITDGFTVDNEARSNSATDTYYWVAFADNGAGDLHVGSYTGNGSAGHAITGVGFQPDGIWIFGAGARIPVVWLADHPAGPDRITIWAGNAGDASGYVTAVGSDGFTLGAQLDVNADTETYYYIAFKEAAGIFNQLAYTGDATDDRDVPHGLSATPTFVAITNNDAAFDTSVWTDDFAAGNSTRVDGVGNLTNRIQAVGATNVQVGTDTGVNGSGNRMLMQSFAAGESVAAGGPGKGNSGGGRGRGNRGGGGGNGRGRGANKFAWNRYRFLGR